MEKQQHSELTGKPENKDLFKVLKENNFQPIILQPAKVSFINEGKVKAF